MSKRPSPALSTVPTLQSSKDSKMCDCPALSAVPTTLRSSKDSKMCDCALEVERRKKKEKKDKKTSHSAQTDAPGSEIGAGGIDFSALFSGMLDGVGPWIPYIGGSVLVIMFLGYLSTNLDKFLGMFDVDFEESPASNTVTTPEPRSPLPEPTADSCSAKCALHIDTDKIKWPNR